MVDFQTLTRTMRIADSEDRALLGSNPSAAVGDGDISRSFGPTEAPAPRHFFFAVLVQKSDKPIIVRHHSTVVKIRPVTRPVCRLAISNGAKRISKKPQSYKHLAPLGRKP
jgi:hypothetical protein